MTNRRPRISDYVITADLCLCCGKRAPCAKCLDNSNFKICEACAFLALETFNESFLELGPYFDIDMMKGLGSQYRPPKFDEQGYYNRFQSSNLRQIDWPSRQKTVEPINSARSTSHELNKMIEMAGWTEGLVL